MHTIQNTFPVMTPRAYAHLENAPLRIDAEREKKLQEPLHHLGGMVKHLVRSMPTGKQIGRVARLFAVPIEHHAPHHDCDRLGVQTYTPPHSRFSSRPKAGKALALR